MDDILARVFVIFLLILYTSVALVFVVAVIRNWVWQPIKRKLRGRSPQKSYRGINSASHGESPS